MYIFFCLPFSFFRIIITRELFEEGGGLYLLSRELIGLVPMMSTDKNWWDFSRVQQKSRIPYQAEV